MASNQTIYIENGGYYLVVTVVSSTSVTITNLNYPGNTSIGVTIPSGSKVVPAGVIGAQGATGSGAQGSTGASAYTTTSLSYTQPNISSTVSVRVADTSWMGSSQIVYVEGGGYYSVYSISNSTTVVLTNLEYSGNTAPSSTISSGAKVSPGGLIGPQGYTGDTGTTGYTGATGPTGAQGSSATTSAVIVFGGSLPTQSVTGTYYLLPGGAGAAASSTQIKLIVPFSGTLTNFKVMHNTTSSSVTMTYTVSISGGSSITPFTVSSGSSTGSSNATLSVSNGDQIIVSVQWGSTTAANLTNVVFSMKIQ